MKYSSSETRMIIDELIRQHGTGRAAIAYLTGYVESLESRLNVVRSAIGAPQELSLSEELQRAAMRRPIVEPLVWGKKKKDPMDEPFGRYSSAGLEGEREGE